MMVLVQPLKNQQALGDARNACLYVMDALSMETADEMNSDSAGESVM